MYAQVGSISTNDLPAEQAEWLEAQDAFLFAVITDGDESEPREIAMEALPYEQVLAEASQGERILIDNQNISFCPGLEGKVTQKSYWGGETIFVL